MFCGQRPLGVRGDSRLCCGARAATRRQPRRAGSAWNAGEAEAAGHLTRQKSMRPNAVKSKLAAGGTALGAFMFEFATTGVARLAAEAGADFAVFDMEHSGWSIETIRMLLATCGGTSLVPLVRVPTTEYDLIARAPDIGR